MTRAESTISDRIHRSVFARLVVIMVTLAVGLLAVVSVFFWVMLERRYDISAVYPTDKAHLTLIAVLLVVIVLALWAAHGLIRRLLRPLRQLGDGVARLSEGELDVSLPPPSRDEFGKLTEAFNTMVARVRGQIQAREQLLVDVSHELRSPLTRLKVGLELLPPGVRREQLAADAAEMEAMIAGLLELERLRVVGHREYPATDLGPVVRDVVAAFADRAPGVSVTGSNAPVVAAADPAQVRTVLRNLLENALKYSTADSGPVEVSLESEGDRRLIRVTDDGIGIPDEDRERVFDPFFRVDRSRTRATGGYGLGLSICRRIMEAHRGSIVAERAGRGTAFVLTFPAPAVSGGPAPR